MVKRLFPVLLLFLAVRSQAIAIPMSTGNQFVSAIVADGTGVISFLKGNSQASPPSIPIGQSVLWLTVRGRAYSNSAVQVRQNGLLNIVLNNGINSRIADTIETIWKQTGFDIIQDVYPVAFEISGQIVYKIRAVNHFPDTLTVQVTIDIVATIANSMSSGVVTDRSYYNNAAHFFLGYQYPAPDTDPGTLSMGYFNDTIAPRPMGLLPPATFGIYQDGSSNLNGLSLQWAKSTLAGNSPTIRELAKSSYGTGEFEVCSTNGTRAITFYPHRINYDSSSKRYLPNPFRVESLVFTEGYMEEPSFSLAVDGPLRILSPLPYTSPTRTQTQVSPNIPAGGYGVAKWTDTTLDISNLYGDSIAYLSLGVEPLHYPVQFDSPCSMPIIIGNGRSPAITSDTVAPAMQAISAAPGFRGNPCNSQCRTIAAIDTGAFETGIESVVLTASDNMHFTLDPFAKGTQPVTFSVCVVDSMQDASATVAIADLNGNADTEQFSYCTIPDTIAPYYTVSGAGRGINLNFHEGRPWDRGLDSLALWDTVNVYVSPSPLALTRGAAGYTLGFNRRDTSKPMSYCVKAFDKAGNVSSDYCFSTFESGVSNPAAATSIALSVYPNPTSSIVTVEVAGLRDANIEVLDVLGRVVQTGGSGRILDAGEHQEIIDLSASPAGTYYLRISLGRGEVRTIKLVKE